MPRDRVATWAAMSGVVLVMTDVGESLRKLVGDDTKPFVKMTR